MFEKLRLEPMVLVAVTLVGILGLSSVVFSLSSNILTITSSGAIVSLSPLHVQGHHIVDDQNNTVILRGVDVGDFQAFPGGLWDDAGLATYSDWQNNQALITTELNEIQSWGCNVVRSQFAARYWVLNQSGFQVIIPQYANLLAQRGMYLILVGYTVQDYWHRGNQDPLPYPPYSTGSPNASAIIPSITAYENMMLQIALAVKNHPNVIIELWNEPAGNTTNSWYSVEQATINSIRSNGVQNIILTSYVGGIWVNLQYPPASPPTISPPTSGETMSWVYQYPLNGSNIVYDVHYYDGFINVTNGGIGHGGLTYAETMNGMIDTWVPYVLNTLNKPIIFGEIGANVWLTGSNLNDELKSFNNTFAALNNLGIGYCAWEFRTGMKYSLISSYAPSWTPTGAGTIFIARAR